MAAARPWWENDPQLMALKRQAIAEIEEAQLRPIEPHQHNAIQADLLSGAGWRELAHARDDLADAKVRYAAAIRSARAVGFSWGEIGRVLGVPKQLLHRRFRDDVG